MLVWVQWRDLVSHAGPNYVQVRKGNFKTKILLKPQAVKPEEEVEEVESANNTNKWEEITTERCFIMTEIGPKIRTYRDLRVSCGAHPFQTPQRG